MFTDASILAAFVSLYLGCTYYLNSGHPSLYIISLFVIRNILFLKKVPPYCAYSCISSVLMQSGIFSIKKGYFAGLTY